jgi:hypothetical protein
MRSKRRVVRFSPSVEGLERIIALDGASDDATQPPADVGTADPGGPAGGTDPGASGMDPGGPGSAPLAPDASGSPDPGVDLGSASSAGPTLNGDGTCSSTTPDGTVVTTYPDGTITVQPASGDPTIIQPPGQGVIAEDGLTTTYSPDGTQSTVYPDGSVWVQAPSGSQAPALCYPAPDPNPPADIDDDGVPDTSQPPDPIDDPGDIDDDGIPDSSQPPDPTDNGDAVSGYYDDMGNFVPYPS